MTVVGPDPALAGRPSVAQSSQTGKAVAEVRRTLDGAEGHRRRHHGLRTAHHFETRLRAAISTERPPATAIRLPPFSKSGTYPVDVH